MNSELQRAQNQNCCRTAFSAYIFFVLQNTASVRYSFYMRVALSLCLWSMCLCIFKFMRLIRLFVVLSHNKNVDSVFWSKKILHAALCIFNSNCSTTSDLLSSCNFTFTFKLGSNLSTLPLSTFFSFLSVKSVIVIFVSLTLSTTENTPSLLTSTRKLIVLF